MDEELLKRNAVADLQVEDVNRYKNIWVKENRITVWKFVGTVVLYVAVLTVIMGILSIKAENIQRMVYVFPLMTLIPMVACCFLMQLSAGQISKHPAENFSRGLIYVIEIDTKNNYVIYKYAENGEIKEVKWRFYKEAGKIRANEYATMIYEKDNNQRLICEDISWKV